jgi:hypothetical protein
MEGMAIRRGVCVTQEDGVIGEKAYGPLDLGSHITRDTAALFLYIDGLALLLGFTFEPGGEATSIACTVAVSTAPCDRINNMVIT